MIHRMRWVLFGLLLLAVGPYTTLARPLAAVATSVVRAGNLRAEPTTTARIVAELQAGTAVSAAARSGDWARVSVTKTGARGWVIRSLLALTDKQWASLPVEGNQTTAPPASGPTTAVRGTTILLMGSDRRPGDTSSRADALLLLRLDPQAGTVSVLSLPRDLLVYVPGVGNTKINAGYQYGGIALQKQTVSQLLGVRIDYGVAINFDGFAGLVDALGGVSINVPRRLVDPAYPTANYGTIRVVFEPGVQQMNGARALIYARMRHPDSDFGRMRRQQQALAALASRMQARGVGGALSAAANLAANLNNYVLTDMPVSAMGGILYDAARTFRASRQFVIDGNYCSQDPNSSSLIPNHPAIARLVAQWAAN